MQPHLADDPVLDPAGVIEVAVLTALHAACFEDCWSVQAMGEVMAGAGVFGTLASRRNALGERLPVGFAIARVVGEDSELLSLGVIAAARRRAVGRRLVADTLHQVAARGARRIFLEVAEDNFAAQALYRSFDFRLVGRRPDYYRRADGGATAALTLRRNIDAAT